MIAHKVTFQSNGQRSLGQAQPIVLPKGPETVVSNGESTPSIGSVVIFGLAALAAVYALTQVIRNAKD